MSKVIHWRLLKEYDSMNKERYQSYLENNKKKKKPLTCAMQQSTLICFSLANKELFVVHIV